MIGRRSGTLPMARVYVKEKLPMAATRTATVTWTGKLADGDGTVHHGCFLSGQPLAATIKKALGETT